MRKNTVYFVFEEKQEKAKAKSKDSPKAEAVDTEEGDLDLQLHCQMTENLIEPNKVFVLIVFMFINC